MDLKNKIIHAFNKFFINLIKDIKLVNDDINIRVKKNYKMIDKSSDIYLLFFRNQFEDVNVQDLTLDVIKDSYILEDITINDVISGLTSDKDIKVFWTYLYILYINMLMYNENSELLFTNVLTIISKIQSGSDCEELFDNILDDDISYLLNKIVDNKETESVQQNDTQNDTPPPLLPDFMNDSSSVICNLAKEISNEIDISNIKTDSTEDILKLLDFNSSNNIVGNIIQKVSSKIHDKINNGQLNQQDLFGEAMNMMSKLNMGGEGFADILNNPMMANMMKNMKGGKAVPNNALIKKNSAKERLRSKLNERKNT